jgi:branched-chain amino acid transport system permease protein
MKEPLITIVGFGLLAIVIAVLPLTATNYLLRLTTIGFMYVALASSWNIIGGFTGYPSFATAAFFGIGAYASGILRARTGLFLPLAWLCGSASAIVFSLMVGPAILRLRGHYFAVASLVLAAVLREITNAATWLTGGGMGINLPVTGNVSVDEQTRLYYASMLAAALMTVGLATLIWRSRWGWAMRCVEQNEDAAMVLGVNTLAAKILGFAASAGTAGLAGAIYATWIGYIDPTDVFDDLLSVKPIVMSFIGGVGTIFGPVAGAIIFLVLEEFVWRNVLNFHAGILGTIIVALLIFMPGGLRSVANGIEKLRTFGRASRIGRAEPPVTPS